MLKGVITKEGLLMIERAGTMKVQYCPYHPAGLECGDWCPKFQEPLELTRSNRSLQLCNETRLMFHSLEDHRQTDDVSEAIAHAIQEEAV